MVDAALVSRLHCRLSAGTNELQVDDLDSTNGTFVNGTRVTCSKLKEGDRLGVGRVELVNQPRVRSRSQIPAQKRIGPLFDAHRRRLTVPGIDDGVVREREENAPDRIQQNTKIAAR